MSERLAIGVDIGGTKVAFALVNEQGDVLASHRLPMVSDGDTDAALNRVAEGIQYILSEAAGKVAGVGIGSPGHVDGECGMVHNAVNLNWEEVDLRGGVQARLDAAIPVWIEKDANAAALGEKFFGAARGCDDFIYFGIGTGLGGGAVVNGQLVTGANAYAMEVGHLSLNPQGRQCACGLRGCPEMYLSGTGLAVALQEHLPNYSNTVLLEKSSPEDILNAARNEDAFALHLLDEMREWLVTVLAYTTAMFNPALVVIGGGLGHAAADFLLQPAYEALAGRVLPATYDHLQLVESQVHSSAVGAACLVWQSASA